MNPVQIPQVSGLFVAVEGLDGAGSTTQAARLATWLAGQGYTAVQAKEPTAGPAGMLLRMALRERMVLDGKSMAMLFLADRMDHLYREPDGILRLLQDPKMAVVADRYYLSSFAYQVLEPGIDLQWLRRIHAKCLPPVLTVFLNVPAQECIRRIGVNRGFHFELFEKDAQLERVQKNYFRAIRLLREEGENIQIVDGEGTPDEVEARIRAHVLPLLSA